MNYGRALVTNAATTLLLKQNPAALDAICETFKLSEGERAFLVAADVGEGVLLAGGNHIALSFRIPEDHALYRLITTRPEETIEYGGYEEEADKE